MQLSTRVDLVPIVSTSSFSCFLSLADGALYTATATNFRGLEPVMMRSTDEIIRTESTSTWLNGEIMGMSKQTFNRSVLMTVRTHQESRCNTLQHPGKHHSHFFFMWLFQPKVFNHEELECKTSIELQHRPVSFSVCFKPLIFNHLLREEKQRYVNKLQVSGMCYQFTEPVAVFQSV